MGEKILIVEDQSDEAEHLQLVLENAGYEVTGIAHSVARAQALIAVDRPDLVLLDIVIKGRQSGIDLAKELAKDNIAFVYLSDSSTREVLNAAKLTQPYGFLVKPFRENDLLIMLEIARYRHEYGRESVSRKEQVLINKLESLKNNWKPWERTLLNICLILQSRVSFDYVTAGFNTITDESNKALSYLRIGTDEYQRIGIPELLTISKLKMKELLLYEKKGRLNELFAKIFDIKSGTSLSLFLPDGQKFNISFYSRETDTYTPELTAFLHRIRKTITEIINTALHDEVVMPVEPIYNLSVADRSPDLQGFDSVVGQSPLLMNVFDLTSRVAGSDTSVLILGESGTGKERIADCIHNLSPRGNNPFIKVNCATLPPALIESELFGYEKGAFTGATDRRIGKFEKAHQGTIFLDEIGEMTPDLQVKLLRVLQEKYIERIGSGKITKVNIRVIAATNRNLEKEVSEGRFRLDLFYRLNVFPIVLPPLRDRIEDIPLLAGHFLRLFNSKAGKKIRGISDKVVKRLKAYNWPGNIRELENIIERAVLLARGSIIDDIRLPSPVPGNILITNEGSRIKTIHENERDYIINVLQKCKGRIWGAGGAAETMDLPPTTLASRMKKLAIRKVNIL
ncbi:MAG: sigma 54-interacting transcriptional regulator [Chitinophagaceae bacterium]